MRPVEIRSVGNQRDQLLGPQPAPGGNVRQTEVTQFDMT